MTESTLRDSIVGRALRCREFPLDAVARTDLDKLLAGELPVVVAANRLNLTKVSHIRKELLERFCCVGLVLQEASSDV